MLIAVGIVFGGAIGFYFFRQHMIAKVLSNMKTPPVSVAADKVTTDSWSPFFESVGTFVAPQSTSILPEQSGIVTSINFKSGEMVKKGQLLVALDTRAEHARLSSDQASLRLAKINYNRNKGLYARGAVSRQDYDTATANLQEAQAAVRADKVAISQKHITAPFSGQIGIRKVNLGEYISTMSNSSTGIATIEQINPLYIDFQLPQQYIPQLAVGQQVNVMVDSYNGETFTGKISAFSVGVDQDSRMVTVRAEVPNAQHKLRSGMFGTVRVILPEHRSIITVPQTAIAYNFYGDIVYVIKNGKAVQTFVEVGERRGNKVEVIKGLKPGETVVTAGQIKLFNGAPVVVIPNSNPGEGAEDSAMPSQTKQSNVSSSNQKMKRNIKQAKKADTSGF